MKKIILIATVGTLLSLTTSCNKCNTCTGAKFSQLNHDYCNGIYDSAKSMEAAKEACEFEGGVWAEKAE
ncbi:MAG: hypothetical protein ACPGR5_02775 [Chitinophagales bacterium]